MKIIAIITTKNRLNLFKKALNSVLNQTRKPDLIIVVSDSTKETKVAEKALLLDSGVFLECAKTHNYAGSLNTAVEFLALHYINELENVFFASLDDDDEWTESYLQKCEIAAFQKDFVACGLHYNDEKIQPKQILTLSDFLRGNPGIQGSNTFVRFSTLLKAGAFDENLPSTIDRDFFVRVMLSGAKFSVIDEILVFINADNRRIRITNSNKKAEGLKKFYAKYRKLFSKDDESEFFRRCENVFNVSRSEFVNSKVLKDTPPLENMAKFGGRIVAGFVSDELTFTQRILTQLQNSLTNFSVVVVDNGDVGERVDELFKTKNIKFIKPLKKLESVSEARSFLHEKLYKNSVDGDVVWVLDDDMELYERVVENGSVALQKLDVCSVVGEFSGRCDALVGEYVGEAPLPLFSTLRRKLVDVVFAGADVEILEDYEDYYYDLSCNKFALTPQNSRELFLQKRELKEAKSRGGNTLIFNRELLKLANISVKIGGVKGRRSDYFWVLQAKEKGFNVLSGGFATLHARSTKFDYEKEAEKLCADLVGASFTKAVESVGLKCDDEAFFATFTGFLKERLARFVCAYAHAFGLMRLADCGEILAKSEQVKFGFESLACLVQNILDVCVFENVVVGFSELKMSLKEKNITIDEAIKTKFGTNLRVLGVGNEGVVFTDEKVVIKSFYKPLSDEAKRALLRTKDMFGLVEIADKFVCYEYADFELFKRGHYAEFAELIYQMYKCGVVFTNFKKENFILTDGKVRLIDFGESFRCAENVSEVELEKHIKRCYEMLFYANLSKSEFSALVVKSYNENMSRVDFGWENFKNICFKRSKEEIHDGVVVSEIEKCNAFKMLDFGAGKCKIAERFGEKMSVYDIDEKTRTNAQKRGVNFVEKDKFEKYDLVNCNLVLCAVDDESVCEILSDISRITKQNGNLILTICNPFFNSVQKSEIRESGICGCYGESEVFVKKVGKSNRTEFHRPFEFYENLLWQHGFTIESFKEIDSADCETMLKVSEFLLLKCVKKHALKRLEDCGLLIKTNPQEHALVYESIKHINAAFSKAGLKFAKRLVVVDGVCGFERTRKFTEYDFGALRHELWRAKKNGLVDEILEVSEDGGVNKRWFECETNATHSTKNQAVGAFLSGVEALNLPFVFQTDSDILFNIDKNSFLKGLKLCKENVSVSLGICADVCDTSPTNERIEVRNCFLNLEKLKALRPLENGVSEGKLTLGWHRSLDLKTSGVRMKNVSSFFIHPQNSKKDFLSFFATCVERGKIPKNQKLEVEVAGDLCEWAEILDEVVVYMCVQNASEAELKRVFDSLCGQGKFKLLYIDDASSKGWEYAKFRVEREFDGLFLRNLKQKGEFVNLGVAMSLVKNKNAVVINLSSGVALFAGAMERILSEFENGADSCVGKCISTLKPLKRFYSGVKSFKRSLFDGVGVEDSIVKNAVKPLFIDDVICFYEENVK